jgi:hypothetical protein
VVGDLEEVVQVEDLVVLVEEAQEGEVVVDLGKYCVKVI